MLLYDGGLQVVLLHGQAALPGFNVMLVRYLSTPCEALDVKKLHVVSLQG